MSVDKRLDDFAQALCAEDLASATVRAYRHDVGLFARWLNRLYPSTTLEELSSTDIQAYRQYLVAERKARPATVNRRLEALRRLCRWAHAHKILTSNPADGMKPVRQVRRKRPNGMMDSEAHALLRAAGASNHGMRRRNYALVQCLLQTGIRVGELVTLCVGDVLLRDRVGMLRVREGKGRKAREVPLNASARRALRSYLALRPGLKAEDPFFLSNRGEAMSIRTVQHLIAVLACQARISRVNVTTHTLRHTFSLNFLRQHPGKLVELSMLLGHESLEATALYTRPSMEELSEQVEAGVLNVYK